MAILIVDDSPVALLHLRCMLEQAGFSNVRAATSPEQALLALGLEAGTERVTDVDLVLLDVVMPGMDGVEVCRRIKASEWLRDVPVIMVTAQTEVAQLATAFDAGAIDYLTKPAAEVELLARVRSALRLKTETDARRQREAEVSRQLKRALEAERALATANGRLAEQAGELCAELELRREAEAALREREAELLSLTRRLEAANAELARLSAIDPLTGIANRRTFEQALEAEWRRARRELDCVSVLMLDVDHFKSLNDTFGHPVGDDCLRRVAQVVEESACRQGDVAARYGGEEFAVVLSGTGAGGATVVAEFIREAVSNLRLPAGDASPFPHVTVSVGVATATPADATRRAGADETGELVRAADTALYAAKRLGRNRACAAAETGGWGVVRQLAPAV